jgi:hypothetical protein
MAAYLVLVFAVLSRILPHTFHATGLGFTAVGGGLLFFGARRSRWQTIIAVLALMATDYYLTVFAYGYAFRTSDYLVTWAWYAAVCLMGYQILSKKASALRVVGAVMASATSFFVLSNLVVWAAGTMYPHTAAGLATSPKASAKHRTTTSHWPNAQQFHIDLVAQHSMIVERWATDPVTSAEM